MKKLPTKVFYAALAVSLCLTGCSQPLEGIIGRRKAPPSAVTVPVTPPPPPTAVPPSAGDVSTHTPNGINVSFRYIPAGSFRRDSAPANISVITRGYWMAETEVTQELFQAVMGTNPSYFPNGAVPGETQNKRPVEQASWYAAIAFCNKLSLANGKEPVYSVTVSGTEVDWAGLTYIDIPVSDNADWNAASWGKTKNGYRLPTEMEWMWAAMGADKTVQPNTTGHTKAFAGSNGSNNIDDYAWYGSNSMAKTHEAGRKAANELGLKDMSGNVREWCWDWWADYPAGARTDYAGAASGTDRVFRGGSWSFSMSKCKVSSREEHNVPPHNNENGNLGFRLVYSE